MKRLLLVFAAAGLLGGLTGCQVVTGNCDCVELPPPVTPIPHPGPGPGPGLAMGPGAAPGYPGGPGIPFSGTPQIITPSPEQIPVNPKPTNPTQPNP